MKRWLLALLVALVCSLELADAPAEPEPPPPPPTTCEECETDADCEALCPPEDEETGEA